jgi:hypothetical protein
VEIVLEQILKDVIMVIKQDVLQVVDQIKVTLVQEQLVLPQLARPLVEILLKLEMKNAIMEKNLVVQIALKT